MTPVTGTTPEIAAALLEKVRERRPLIHHITNIVTAGDVANVTLALGASPIMAHAPDEVEEVTGHAGALVLNIGTLTAELVATMLLAARRANALGIPVILDPVGAGGTAFQRRSLSASCRTSLFVRAGNAGEIAALAGEGGGVHGVEAAGVLAPVDELAQHLARTAGAAVAATGAEDVLTDGSRVLRIENGDPLLARITRKRHGDRRRRSLRGRGAGRPCRRGRGARLLRSRGRDCGRDFERPGHVRVALFDAVAGLDGPTIRGRARMTAL